MLNKKNQTHTAHAKVTLFAALNGYIEVFSPSRYGMLGRRVEKRSPESWLSIAENAAKETDNPSHYQVTIVDVKNLVAASNYKQARKLVSDGMKMAQNELKYVPN